MKLTRNKEISISVVLLLLFLLTSTSFSQYENKWLYAGSFHNWYSSIGCEIEEGFVKQQQYGAMWPAFYNYQDMQAAKALWIGVKDFSDGKTFYPYRVVHVGPRVTGANEFFPVGKMKIKFRFRPTIVSVDGNETFKYDPPSGILDSDIDPNMIGDMSIEHEVNSILGISVHRKIYQFSQQFYDNFHIQEWTFVNTGKTGASDAVTRKDSTLKDVYFFFQYRWAVCRETGYLIGNGSRWGMNTMNDVRGDGLNKVGDKPEEKNLRTQFAWHGYWPDRKVPYDNIGGPIWYSDNINIAKNDTIGRLGAAQFIGVLTVHADKSTTDKSNDPGQPSTTMQASSDDPKTSQNDAFNPTKCAAEYTEWITAGRKFIWNGVFEDRHAYVVQPDGNFVNQTGDPDLNSPGGFSAMNGYGPYTMKYGDTVRLILVEGANGLSREQCIAIGKAFKEGKITTAQKNAEVMKGKDLLMETWRRALDAYANNWNIKKPPLPPKSFSVKGLGNKILLEWEKPNDPTLKGFKIFRATGQLDSTYHLIYETKDITVNKFEDTSAIRGLNYYYYMSCVGDVMPANPALGIPADTLLSSRYYTQTYDPAKLKRPSVEGDLSQARIVPNPFSLGSDISSIRWGTEQPNTIAFLNIPGKCTIRIYTEMGELIKTIHHTNESGDEYWNSVTDSNQIIVSGIYLVVIEDDNTGAKKILKLSVIR